MLPMPAWICKSTQPRTNGDTLWMRLRPITVMEAFTFPGEAGRQACIRASPYYYTHHFTSQHTSSFEIHSSFARVHNILWYGVHAKRVNRITTSQHTQFLSQRAFGPFLIALLREIELDIIILDRLYFPHHFILFSQTIVHTVQVLSRRERLLCLS